MDRYKIAILKSTFPDKACVTFKTIRSLIRLIQCMERCIKKGYILNVSNQKEGLVDAALVGLSKKYSAPIVTQSNITACPISITQAYDRVYPVSRLPEKFSRVICYWDVEHEKLVGSVTPILIIQKIP